MIKQLTNSDKNFYKFLGPIFGSRIVERKTKDRFYDDDAKVWYLYFCKGTPDTFVSIKKSTIKNVWSERNNHLLLVLKEIFPFVGTSIVPEIFANDFESAGYKIDEKSDNFIYVKGGLGNEED